MARHEERRDNVTEPRGLIPRLAEAFKPALGDVRVQALNPARDNRRNTPSGQDDDLRALDATWLSHAIKSGARHAVHFWIITANPVTSVEGSGESEVEGGYPSQQEAAASPARRNESSVFESRRRYRASDVR